MTTERDQGYIKRPISLGKQTSKRRVPRIIISASVAVGVAVVNPVAGMIMGIVPLAEAAAAVDDATKRKSI